MAATRKLLALLKQGCNERVVEDRVRGETIFRTYESTFVA